MGKIPMLTARSYTKEDLCQRYELDLETVCLILRESGLGTEKQTYTDHEVEKTFHMFFCLYSNYELTFEEIRIAMSREDTDPRSFPEQLANIKVFSKQMLADTYQISMSLVERWLVWARLDPKRDNFTREEAEEFHFIRGHLFRQELEELFGRCIIPESRRGEDRSLHADNKGEEDGKYLNRELAKLLRKQLHQKVVAIMEGSYEKDKKED